LGIKSKTVDFNDFKVEEFPTHKLMVTCMATHYEGDPCDNSKKFYKWIKASVKNKESGLLKNMDYAIFGLGDMSYELFNEMGKYFDGAFEKLGGTRVHELGAANAETFSTEEDFFKWKCAFWPAVIAHYSLTCTEVRAKTETKAVDPCVMPYLVVPATEDLERAKDVALPLMMKQYVAAKDVEIASCRQLRQNLEQGSTLEVVFNTKAAGISYKTASNLAIFPENSEADA